MTRTDSSNLAIGIVISLQSALGILGNVSFLFHCLLIYYSEHTLKTVDLILTHVFTANSLIIFSRGVPLIMRTFEWKQIFKDVECKLIFYVYRLGRSMSITSTCLLSVFQAITISPNISYCTNLKVKLPKYVPIFISFLWILYVIVNTGFLMYTSTESNSENKTKMRHFEFCGSHRHSKIEGLLYTAFWVIPEVFFSILIVCSSISMIVTLYGHKKRVQYILSTQGSTRFSPESRATQNILVLVCTFLAFYTISSVLQGCITLAHYPNPWLRNITAIISMCFPTLCPFLMSHDSTFSRFYFFWKRNIEKK